MRPNDNHEEGEPTAKIESTGVNTRKCMVHLLNGQEFQCNVERNANGEQLLRQIRELLDIIEFDYFGLYFEDSAHHKYWLEAKKSIKKQLKNSPWKFNLAVKFYPSDPSQLTEDMSRYYMVLQLKENIVTGSLPCSFVTHALLGSFVVQSELGDYDAASMKGNYVSGFKFAPNQTNALEEKVIELHKTHKGLTPEEAEIAFLENVKKLALYGVDQHMVKDSEDVDLTLGVSWNGLRVYRDQVQINRFAWPKILKISYVRSKFYIRIRPADEAAVESVVGFKLPNHRAAKKLWKSAVEHHTFFRLRQPEVPKHKLIRTGSRFRYAGQTQHQTRQSAATSTRKTVPKIQRTASRRSYVDRGLKKSVSDSPSPPELPKKERTVTKTEVVTEEITEEIVTEKIKEPQSTEVVEVTTTEEIVAVQASEKKPAEEEAPKPTASSSSSLSSMSDEEMDALTKHQKKVHKMKPKSEAEKDVSSDGKFLQEPPPGSRDSSEWDVRLQSSPSKNNGGEDHTHETKETKEEVTVVTTVTTEVVEEVVTSKRKESSSSSSSSSSSEEEEEDKEESVETAPLPDFVPAVEPESLSRSSSSTSSTSSSHQDVEEEVVEQDANEEPKEKSDEEYEEPALDIPEEKQEEKEVTEVVIQNPYTDEVPIEVDHVEEVRLEEVEASSSSSESSSSESGLEEFEAEQNEPKKEPPQEEETNENNNNNEVVPEPVEHKDEEDAVVSQNVITMVETKSVRVEEVVIPREDNEVRKVALTADQDNNVTVTETKSPSTSSSSSSSSDSEDEPAAGDAQPPAFNGFKKPPIVETEAVYVEPTEEEEPAVTTEPPVVQTETRTITYESSHHEPDVINTTNDVQLLSSQTITAETMSSVTTTHITKTVVGSVSETRVEKSIVITAEGDADLHQAMAEAIKDTQENNPDVSITRVVVHEEKVVENP